MKPTARMICAVLLAAAGPVAAQVPAEDGALRGGWYAAAMASRTLADDARQTGDGSGFALMLGHRGDFASIELSGLQTSLGDADLTGVQLALLTGPFFDRPVLARLFGIVGFGAFRRENHPQFDEDDTTIFGDVGLGYMHPLRLFGRAFAIRGEARYRYDVQPPPRPEDAPGAFADIVFNLGLQMPLGSGRDPEPEARERDVAVVPVTADADGDGVGDGQDLCPGTPPGAVVDASGCEAPAAVCTVDPVVGAVSLGGCQAGDTLVLPGIRFDSGSAELPEGTGMILQALAQALKEQSRRRVEIGAHTDSQGSAAFNQSLSERRAESVRSFLVSLGTDPGQLTASGYGESRPIDDNDTESGRARNRRVEVTVLE